MDFVVPLSDLIDGKPLPAFMEGQISSGGQVRESLQMMKDALDECSDASDDQDDLLSDGPHVTSNL